MFLDFSSSIKQSTYTYDAASQTGAAGVEKGGKVGPQGEASRAQSVAADAPKTPPDPNTLRALEAAGMPATAENIALVENMMQEGMRIDKSNLQSMYRILLKNPDADSAQLVRMQHIGLEINDVSIRQFESYENQNHQIMDGLRSISDELRREGLSLFEGRDGHGTSDAMQLLKDVIQIAEMPDSATETLKEAQAWMDIKSELKNLTAGLAEGKFAKGDAAGLMMLPEQSAVRQVMALVEGLLMPKEDDTGNENARLLTEDAMTKETDGTQTGAELEGPGRQDAGISFLRFAADAVKEGALSEPSPDLHAKDSISRQGTEKPGQMADGEAAGVQGTPDQKAEHAQPSVDIRSEFLAKHQELILELRQDAGKLAQLNPNTVAYRLEETKFMEKAMQLENAVSGTVKEALFGSKGLLSRAGDQLLDQLMLRPEEVADGKKVEQLYQKLLTRMDHLQQALSNAGLENAQVSQNVMQMQDNVQFMNQLGQIYQYVQLPLKMFEQHTNGDLYVYTNKKHLADPDGNISAFLHLSMDHIGPVDVHVQLGGAGKVQTHFYLESDELIDFISGNMHLLDERLAAKGYQVNSSVTLQTDKEEKSVIEHMMDRQAVSVRNKLLSVSSFDAKA